MICFSSFNDKVASKKLLITQYSHSGGLLSCFDVGEFSWQQSSGSSGTQLGFKKIVAPRELPVLRMMLQKYQPWEVFHQFKKTGRRISVNRDVWTWANEFVANGRLTRTILLFTTILSIVPKFICLQKPVQIFNMGIARYL
jgi:hypothetical protein